MEHFDRFPTPLHLVGYTRPASRPAGFEESKWDYLATAGWIGMLASPDGQTEFKVAYHGTLFNDEVIIGTVESPSIVYAITNQDEKVLLFDGSLHGYNAMFSDTWKQSNLDARRVDKTYVDADGADRFQLLIWAGYSIDYDEEWDDYVDEANPDVATLIDGRTMSRDEVRQAGFDWLAITTVNSRGRTIDILNEELA